MKKSQQTIVKHRTALTARFVACASFLILAAITVSSLVRAMSLEKIDHENGVPTSWHASSLGNPDTITVPIAYWDQRQDSCDDPNRQFEWVECHYWTSGTIQGIVQDRLGSDGLPVPSFTNSTDAWNANLDVFSMNVTGHNPVQPTDNFYRWFHETSVSKRYNREITFNRTGKNTYVYGRDGVFPLDDVDFSKDDSATKSGHNFHFTSHMRVPIKVSASGVERFEFSGDDDVWVFLNGRLVLDIGGLHEKISGWFKINQDGTVTSSVEHVNDPSVRTQLPAPSNDYNKYMKPLNDLNAATYKTKTITRDIGIKEGDVVNLDFFYAERSTTESNTKITIANMNWPISADSSVEAIIAGKIEDSESNLVEFNTDITNRDPENALNLERLAAYVQEDAEDGHDEGFLPLNNTTLFYTATPSDASSWKPVEISAPSNTTNGFNLAQPIYIAPAGKPGDTIYFRYYAETSEYNGKMSSTVSYYTTLGRDAGITYDYDTVEYSGKSMPVITEQKVTISYLYEDGSEAKPTYHSTFRTGDVFEILSPEIDGFTANILSVSGTIANEDLVYIVRYAKNPDPIPEPDPEPETYTVTIHYIYTDGTTAADDYRAEFAPNAEYNIASPIIDGFTSDFDTIDGIVAYDDLEFIVRYTKNPDPIPEPEPEPEPEIPILPIIPGTDTINGDILHLNPLGEVSFVPNTGIVSNAIAGLFNADFAAIVLSQAFVMIMLLIFASSFAVYFSLRKFIIVPAMATTGNCAKTNTKKSAKARANCSSAKLKNNTRKMAHMTAKNAKKTKK